MYFSAFGMSQGILAAFQHSGVCGTLLLFLLCLSALCRCLEYSRHQRSLDVKACEDESSPKLLWDELPLEMLLSSSDTKVLETNSQTALYFLKCSCILQSRCLCDESQYDIWQANNGLSEALFAYMMQQRKISQGGYGLCKG